MAYLFLVARRAAQRQLEKRHTRDRDPGVPDGTRASRARSTLQPGVNAVPYVSDAELMKLDTKIEKQKEKLSVLGGQSAMANLVDLGAAALGAGGFGFLRGKMEDPATGQWNVPGTTVDVELATVLSRSAIAVGGNKIGLKPLQPIAARLAPGIIGHYAGQVGRKAGRTGEFSLSAGSSIGSLPQYDPTSYDPTQFSAPYDDPVAAALASSGV
jgi:hypothetical protein